MFLICGVVTITLGILVLLFLPDNPMSSRLSQQEKIFAIERIRSNKTGIENKRFNRRQLNEALLDPHVLLIVILGIAESEINGALGNFQSSIINS
jgi:sugar phosphate permease